VDLWKHQDIAFCPEYRHTCLLSNTMVLQPQQQGFLGTYYPSDISFHLFMIFTILIITLTLIAKLKLMVCFLSFFPSLLLSHNTLCTIPCFHVPLEDPGLGDSTKPLPVFDCKHSIVVTARCVSSTAELTLLFVVCAAFLLFNGYLLLYTSSIHCTAPPSSLLSVSSPISSLLSSSLLL
jgi:hypothetical protein